MKISTKLKQPLPPPPWPHTTMGSDKRTSHIHIATLTFLFLFFYLVHDPPMKIGTKLKQPLLSPPWPHTTMGRKWQTDFAYQCRNIDVPFSFLLPCLCDVRLSKYYNKGDWPHSYLQNCKKAELRYNIGIINKWSSREDQRAMIGLCISV